MPNKLHIWPWALREFYCEHTAIEQAPPPAWCGHFWFCMSYSPDFSNGLAPFPAGIEDTNFDWASVRRLLPEIESLLLVVGAGQAWIAADLQTHGFECYGVDLGPDMIRQAKLRRGISLVQADARATLREGRRVASDSGNILVAFYETGADLERFPERVKLTRNHQLASRESLEK